MVRRSFRTKLIIFIHSSNCISFFLIYLFLFSISFHTIHVRIYLSMYINPFDYLPIYHPYPFDYLSVCLLSFTLCFYFNVFLSTPFTYLQQIPFIHSNAWLFTKTRATHSIENYCKRPNNGVNQKFNENTIHRSFAHGKTFRLKAKRNELEGDMHHSRYSTAMGQSNDEKQNEMKKQKQTIRSKLNIQPTLDTHVRRTSTQLPFSRLLAKLELLLCLCGCARVVCIHVTCAYVYHANNPC